MPRKVQRYMKNPTSHASDHQHTSPPSRIKSSTLITKPTNVHVLVACTFDSPTSHARPHTYISAAPKIFSSKADIEFSPRLLPTHPQVESHADKNFSSGAPKFQIHYPHTPTRITHATHTHGKNGKSEDRKMYASPFSQITSPVAQAEPRSK